VRGMGGAGLKGDSADDRIAGLHGAAGETVRAQAADGAAVGPYELASSGRSLRPNLENLDWWPPRPAHTMP